MHSQKIDSVISGAVFICAYAQLITTKEHGFEPP